MDLEALAPIIEEIVKNSLNEKAYQYGHPTKGMTNRVATGNLMNSIQAEAVETEPGIQIIQLTAFGKRLPDTYAYWLIEGRKPGKFPNVTAIKDWIRNKKSFRIRDLKTGKYLPKDEKNINRVAFLVGRAMKENGYQNKPENFITISIEKIIADPRVMDIIGDAAVEDLINAIEGI
jgi:hypothetical protein